MGGIEIGEANFVSLTTCPVCSSSDLHAYKKGTFDSRNLSPDHIKITDSEYGKIWDLCQCRSCSYVFANPSPTPHYIETLYGEVEDPLYEEEALGRGKNFTKILNRLEKIHPEKGGLFDVGAATGILLRLALERDWIAQGIEPSGWAVDFARNTYGIDIIHGAFEDASLPAQTYDAVTMIDIIEHLSNPREAVNKAAEVLKPGGILCLVTPDINSLAAKLAGLKWWHFRPGHLGYFTKKSIETLLKLSGFRILKRKKYAWTFSAHYLLSRKKVLHFLINNPRLALFWKKISIKLALSDSMEIYAEKTAHPQRRVT